MMYKSGFDNTRKNVINFCMIKYNCIILYFCIRFKTNKMNTLSLNSMSIEEKIQTMEAIWDDLCKNPESLQSPSWHESILEERAKMIVDNKDVFVDWENAKDDIRTAIS